MRDGPLERPALLEAVWAQQAYPLSPHAARMLDRDIAYLHLLGITVERSATRPSVFTLRGGTLLFTEPELRILALLRDTFDESHPQSQDIHALLNRLTSHLTRHEQQLYYQRQALQVPVQPAIDYTPYAALTAQLETAIAARQLVRFAYWPAEKPTPTLHRQVEPFAIEYYERHFYFVGYSFNTGQIHDFRIDRIQEDDHFALLERMPPEMAHERQLITFRYRLAAVLARGEISQRFANQRVIEHRPNGDVIIEAEGRSSFFIRRTLLKYAGNAELLEPAWLRAEMAADVAALARLYTL
ncbi:MAG: WYL domain-containing protein [Chloroflexaceae bacterium]|nr:WYL domain-containing protein [Chloroflexaceae bacterium]